MRTLPNIQLKIALMKKNLTQRDLSFATRIDEARISKIIRGYERPSEDIKSAISAFLGMESDDLFPD